MSEYTNQVNWANQFPVLEEDEQLAFSGLFSPNVGLEGADGLFWTKLFTRQYATRTLGFPALALDYISPVSDSSTDPSVIDCGFTDGFEQLQPAESWPLRFNSAPDVDNAMSTSNGLVSSNIFPDGYFGPLVNDMAVSMGLDFKQLEQPLISPFLALRQEVGPAINEYSSRGLLDVDMYGATFPTYNEDAGSVNDDYFSQGLQDMDMYDANFFGSVEPVQADQGWFAPQPFVSAATVGNNILPSIPNPPAQVPNICSQFPCIEAFKRDSDRIRHETGVHGINRPLYLCHIPGCVKGYGVGYTRKDKLTEHMWKKHAALGYLKRT